MFSLSKNTIDIEEVPNMKLIQKSVRTFFNTKFTINDEKMVFKIHNYRIIKSLNGYSILCVNKMMILKLSNPSLKNLNPNLEIKERV